MDTTMTYQQQATVGATGVELVLALYDGAVRALYRARECVKEDDSIGRRLAVKKFVDIVMYLQARLRPDVGGSAAAAVGGLLCGDVHDGARGVASRVERRVR